MFSKKINLLKIFKFSEECHLMRCDAEWSGRNILTFSEESSASVLMAEC
jgi:hypothetical protein